MNSSVPQSIIDRALESDASAGAAEYLAEFRSDVETYIVLEVIETCMIANRHELPYIATNSYQAFTDLAGGGGSDSLVLCIGHAEGDGKIAIIDLIDEVRPPCNPTATVRFAAHLHAYGLRRVEGDRWGGEWPATEFREHQVEYDVAEKPKSILYAEALPVLNSHRCELLDVPRLRAQLLGLERRTARGGRDSIDHAPGGHDDVSNAVCGLIAKLTAEGGDLGMWARLGEPDAPPVPPVVPRPEPDLLSAANSTDIARLVKHAGEVVAIVRLPAPVVLHQMSNRGPPSRLPAKSAIEIPSRLLVTFEGATWLIRENYGTPQRVMPVELLSIIDPASLKEMAA
jgi:hypothetical protein